MSDNVINKIHEGIKRLLLNLPAEKDCSDISSDQDKRLKNIQSILVKDNNKNITLEALKNGCKLLEIDIPDGDDRVLIYLQIWEAIKKIIFRDDYNFGKAPLVICSNGSEGCGQPIPKFKELNMPDICPFCNLVFEENTSLDKELKKIDKKNKVQDKITNTIKKEEEKNVSKETNSQLRKSLDTNKNLDFLKVIELDINSIDENNTQFKNRWKIILEQSFLDSLNEIGNIVPIIVREFEKNKYQIISGWRRFLGLKKLNKTKIKAEIISMDDEKCHEQSIVADGFRKNYSPIDIAYKFNEIRKNKNYDLDKTCLLLGYTRSALFKFKRYLTLPNYIKDAIHEKRFLPVYADILCENNFHKLNENTNDIKEEKEELLKKYFDIVIDKKISSDEFNYLVLNDIGKQKDEHQINEPNQENKQDEVKNEGNKKEKSKEKNKVKEEKEKVGPKRENTGQALHEGTTKEISCKVPERVDKKPAPPRQIKLKEGQYISEVRIFDNGDMKVTDNEGLQVEGMQQGGICYLPILLKALNENYETKFLFCNKEKGQKFPSTLQKVKDFAEKVLNIDDYEKKYLENAEAEKIKKQKEKEYNELIERYKQLTGKEFKEDNKPSFEEIKKLVQKEYNKIK